MGLNELLAEKRRRTLAQEQEKAQLAAWPFSTTQVGVAGDPAALDAAAESRKGAVGRDLQTIFSLADDYLAKVRQAALAERDRLADYRVGTATTYRGPNGEEISGGFEGQGGTMFLDPSPDFSPNAVIFTTLDGFAITWGDILKEASANQGTIVHPTTGKMMRFHNELSLEALREWYRVLDVNHPANQQLLQQQQQSGIGSGRAGPTYVRMDQLLVEEVVKGYVVATTGKLHQDLIDNGIDLFNEKHRLGFDLRESQEVDPMMAVKEMVRADKRYSGPHTLRPESVDEMEWIGQRQRALSAFGVAAGKEEDLGIQLATMGAGGSGVRGVAESQIFADSGRLAKSQRDQLVSRASVAMRLI